MAYLEFLGSVTALLFSEIITVIPHLRPMSVRTEHSTMKSYRPKGEGESGHSHTFAD